MAKDVAVTVLPSSKLGKQTPLQWHKPADDDDIQLDALASANLQWLTYKQVVELGGTVKGQKATPAIFFGTGKDKEDTEKFYKFAKLYNIFNIEQTGIELPEIELRQTKLERPYEMADAIKVKISSSTYHNPCYSPSADEIRMPMPGQFETDDAHQSTFYHECIHATGHNSRLARPLTGAFGAKTMQKKN